jgi:hypothetical protein
MDPPAAPPLPFCPERWTANGVKRQGLGGSDEQEGGNLAAEPAPWPLSESSAALLPLRTGEPSFPTLREARLTAPSYARRIEPRVPRHQREAIESEEAMVRRPLGFNCPACGVILIIREPDKYGGEAAPCPHCAVQILPPRIVYSAAGYELDPLPGLSSGFPSRSAIPRVLHRLDRHGKIAWQDTHGEILTAT